MLENNIEELVWKLVFGTSEEKKKAYSRIWNLGKERGVRPASIYKLYQARAGEEIPHDFTVPAINLRGLTFDSARALFKTAKSKKVGAFICEIARSEIDYTDQSPAEYAVVVIAAAIKEEFVGPLFIQGDHFQVKTAKEEEIEEVKELIKKSLTAGFLNFDIDASTLVDYSQKTIELQQQKNIEVTACLSKFVRSIEPREIRVCLGGEIGHIGGRNSTEAELRVFMDGFIKSFPGKGNGLSKISCQTGTHHGGVVLPNGKLADVGIDFATLKNLSRMARKYGLAGAVQHGASTLADEYFVHFPQTQTIEVHLATGFQNMIMDHPKFPKSLLKKMYDWLDKERIVECKANQTREQFHYNLRKKAWAKFKKECWSLPEEVRAGIRQTLEERFAFLFKSLGVENSKEMVEKYI